MPLRINTPYVLLCEGDADIGFFEFLGERSNLKDIYCVPKIYKNNNRLYGVTSYPEMLNELGIALGSDPAPKVEVKGIVLCADAADSPEKTTKQLEQHIKFAQQKHPRLPPMHILLLPANDRPGGLETLCLDQVRSQNAQAEACLATFMKCMKEPVRGKERQDKARLACITAATEDDPTRTVKRQFGPGKPYDASLPIFDGVARALSVLCSS